MPGTSLKIGVVGGSGFENSDFIKNPETKIVNTPYGDAQITTGVLSNTPVVFVRRHGAGHRSSPTNVPYRANMYALHEQGCTHVLASNATGSLTEDYMIGDMVFVDDFIDVTKGMRANTFYDGEPNHLAGVAHLSMNDPFCKQMRDILTESAISFGVRHHTKGTIVVIEGPRYSSLAESNLYRSWGAQLIGMTTTPEVFLAGELGMLYATVANITDFDIWKQEEEAVTASVVLERFAVFRKNLEKVLADTICRMEKIDWTDAVAKKQAAAKDAVLL